MYLVALAANLIVLPIALRALPVSAYVIQALFTLSVVLLSYVAHKYFSFGGGQGNAPASERRPESRDHGGV